MNLEEKVGQMLMVGFHGLEAPDYLLQWVNTGRVGGIILFGRNVESPSQLAHLTQTLHAAARFPLLIGIDQEGGTVSRLRQAFCESPGAMALSSAQSGVELAEQTYRILALELLALGINWDYAPVLDVFSNPYNQSVGTRCFGSNPDQVSAMGVAAMRGIQSARVAACAKHFPGLGSTAIDTHLALPVLDTATDQLIAQDMQPFRAVANAGIASIMTTHTIFSALDTKLPATLSPTIINQLLREELGYQGVVTSDCMEMKAIADHFSPAETAVLGAQAGLDLILFSHTRAMQEAAYDGLLDSARRGNLTNLEAANARVAAMKAAYCAQTPDITRIRQPEHVQVMLEAARAGTTLVRGNDLIPLLDGAALIEFASHFESGILENGGMTGLATQLRHYSPTLPVIMLNSAPYMAEATQAAESLARTAMPLILATRNAFLNPDQLQLARHLALHAKQVILVCLRNPFDADAFPGIQTVICTCGDSEPSLQAAAEAINGVFVPSGKLPVSIKL